MKKLLFILPFLVSIAYGQAFDAARYASHNKPNNAIPLYNKSFWVNGSDFTITGMTLSFNADSTIRIPPGLNDFSKYMTINGLTNTDENVDFEMIFKITTISGSTTGTPIGKKSSNAFFSRSLSVNLDFSQTSGIGTFLRVGNGLGTTRFESIYTGHIAPLPKANDLISLTYSQRGSILNVYYRNITTGFFASSPLIISNLHQSDGTMNWQMPNTGNFCIWNNNAGQTDILSIKITSFSNPNPNVMWIGDSKTQGTGANNVNSRAANLCKSLGSMTVMAGVGDRLIDILTDTTYLFTFFHPKYVVLCAGRNDIQFGSSAATYEANYDALVAAFKRHGWQVIHLLPIPETSISQNTLTNYINSTYTADQIIDPSVGWVNGTDLSSDAVHPSPAGYSLIANQFKHFTVSQTGIQFEKRTPIPNSLAKSITLALVILFFIVCGFSGYYLAQSGYLNKKENTPA